MESSGKGLTVNEAKAKNPEGAGGVITEMPKQWLTAKLILLAPGEALRGWTLRSPS
ncbi:hypothetical protein [Coraliomargarita sinensis]|uniref:hypothetical protein n=1 Tax=Coraliomargarita sinensis TaxID=2174842 RepID=UPI001304FD44|nr:hypothetical protein [Coraliomargarita sinensis]